MKEMYQPSAVNKTEEQDNKSEPFLDLPVLDKIIKRLNRPVMNFHELEAQYNTNARVERGVNEMSLYEKALQKYLQRFGVETPIKKNCCQSLSNTARRRRLSIRRLT